MKPFILCFILFIASCASAGKSFNESAISTLKPGVTTYREAVESIGKPHQVINQPDKTVVQWLYVESNGFTGETQTKNLVVLFDTAGKMIRIHTVQGLDSIY